MAQELHKGVRFSSESNKVSCNMSIVTTGGYVGEKIQETQALDRKTRNANASVSRTHSQGTSKLSNRLCSSQEPGCEKVK